MLPKNVLSKRKVSNVTEKVTKIITGNPNGVNQKFVEGKPGLIEYLYA